MAATKGGKKRRISSAKASGIATFTKFGGSVSGYTPKGRATAGTKLADGRIIKKPKPVLNSGLRSGGAVKITNPDTLPSAQAKKSTGLGFGVGFPKG